METRCLFVFFETMKENDRERERVGSNYDKMRVWSEERKNQPVTARGQAGGGGGGDQSEGGAIDRGEPSTH